MGCTRHKARGAAMVEFAIVLPVLLMVVLGAIDWGWFFFVQDAAINSAREGARAGALGGDGEGRARARLDAMLPPAKAAECDPVGTAVDADTYRVVVTCPVGSLSGVTEIPPFTWVQPPTATGHVEMRR